jgi:hypothetical protein
MSNQIVNVLKYTNKIYDCNYKLIHEDVQDKTSYKLLDEQDKTGYHINGKKVTFNLDRSSDEMIEKIKP